MVVGIIIVAVLIALYFVFDRRRYLGRRASPTPPDVFHPTEEVFRDPGSGTLTRVYENPATGERQYRPE